MSSTFFDATTRRARKLLVATTLALVATAGLGGVPTADAAAAPVPVKVTAGVDQSCALLSDKTVRCWGVYPGNGTTKQATAVTVPINNVTGISSGAHHTCATTGLGNVYCWGSNGYGQLGDGTVTNRLTPVRVGTGDFFEVTAGANHTCAVNRISGGGQLWCWGYNASGQLGLGDTTNRLVPKKVSYPVVVPPMFDGLVSTASAGSSNTCVESSYSVNGVPKHDFQCAGNNAGGAWGNGSTKGSTTFTKVASLSNSSAHIVSVSEGAHQCRQRISTGKVQCTGYNGYGQLGNSTTTDSTTMVTVPGVLKAMSAGYGHTCAFASDFGEYRCWGRNYYGEIGDGTKTNRSSPTPNLKFSGSAAEASVAPGYYHTCAIGHDALKVKRVFCWGTDNVGSLGNGSAAIKLRPTQVTGV